MGVVAFRESIMRSKLILVLALPVVCACLLAGLGIAKSRDDIARGGQSYSVCMKSKPRVWKVIDVPKAFGASPYMYNVVVGDSHLYWLVSSKKIAARTKRIASALWRIDARNYKDRAILIPFTMGYGGRPSFDVKDNLVLGGATYGRLGCDKDELKHFIQRYDISKNRPVWRFGVDGDPRMCAPCVTDTHVFCATDEGALYCLSKKNGKLIWKFKSQFTRPTNLIAVDDVVVVRFATKTDGASFALSQAKGEELGRLGYSWLRLAAGKKRVLFSNLGRVHAYSKNLKKKLWSFAPGADAKPATRLAVGDGDVYVGSVGPVKAMVHCIDQASGKSKWDTEVRGKPITDPILSKECAYVVIEGNPCNVIGLSRKNGRVLWRCELPSLKRPPRKMLFVNGKLWVQLKEKILVLKSGENQ